MRPSRTLQDGQEHRWTRVKEEKAGGQEMRPKAGASDTGLATSAITTSQHSPVGLELVPS